jgi:PIN domain
LTKVSAPWGRSQVSQRLQVLATGGALTLVIPEIVLFELRKTHDRQDLDDKYLKLNRNINKIHMWLEIEDSKRLLSEQSDLLRDEKKQRWQHMYEEILKFLRSQYVSLIPYDTKIECRARERISRREMPRTSNRVDQDAAIIESLVAHFSSIQDPQPILLFCSENHSDFAIPLTKSTSQEPEYDLHPMLAKDLPKTHYFTRLDDLLQVDLGYEDLPKLPEDKEIQEAGDRAEILGSECNFDFDNNGWNEYMQAVEHLDSIIRTRLANRYTDEVIPTLPAEFRGKREDMVRRIRSLLEQCRQCKSWDDRSESKLPQWIEHVPEDMIPYTSLSNLIKIESYLHRYLSIHKKVNDNEKD